MKIILNRFKKVYFTQNIFLTLMLFDKVDLAATAYHEFFFSSFPLLMSKNIQFVASLTQSTSVSEISMKF